MEEGICSQGLGSSLGKGKLEGDRVPTAGVCWSGRCQICPAEDPGGGGGASQPSRWDGK